jgi:hypothetical protein
MHHLVPRHPSGHVPTPSPVRVAAELFGEAKSITFDTNESTLSVKGSHLDVR